jgi:guanylate kinase
VLTRNLEKTGKLIVITGPAGVGKSTIVREVVRRTGAMLSVSVTTRAPRAGEVNGRDYHFIDRPAFDKLVSAGELLEWAQVFAQCYGTPAQPVHQALQAGRTVILEIDVQGGLQVAKLMPQAKYVLILPPDYKELRRRLAGRGTETPEALENRFAKAPQEIETAADSGVYKCQVVNDELERTIAQVCEVVTKE